MMSPSSKVESHREHILWKQGTWSQELKQTPQKKTAYWLAHHGRLTLLSHTT